MQRLVAYLDRQPKRFIILLGILIFEIVAIASYFPGRQFLSFLIFYLLPIALVAWYVNRPWGFFMSFLSTVGWLLSDIRAEASDTFSPVPYWNAAVAFGFFCMASMVAADLKNALQAETAMARTDYLTGLVNRRFFYDLSQMEIHRNRRYGRPFTFVYIDLDDFKSVNDRFGHDAGDLLLRTVADTLKSGFRTTDVAARLGGDEFVVLMPETDFSASKEVLERLRRNLSENLKKRKQTHVTFSIGSVTFAKPPASVEEAMKKTDELMYAVKSGGKNNLKSELYQ